MIIIPSSVSISSASCPPSQSLEEWDQGGRRGLESGSGRIQAVRGNNFVGSRTAMPVHTVCSCLRTLMAESGGCDGDREV